ncbi:6-phosphofructokinase [Patescibacteria group bacterium]|nr:6-phosphofructokinase [Patescibacteria group bacterium]
MKGNLVIGQAGGPTMVINESLVGVIKEAEKHEQFQGIYGSKHGILGILNEDFVNLRQESEKNLETVAKTPSSTLGTCRHKPDEADCLKVFEVFEKYNVKYFFYIGGNDSAETCHIINEIAKKHQYELRIFHIPKTIDNDLLENDFCPGYPSAARYVASSFMGNDLDNQALPGVKIDVVMGRHAGWLTAASALARTNTTDGPHLIYLPERPIKVKSFVKDIDDVYAKYGRCLVAVSEGVAGASGKPLGEAIAKTKDSHGNVQLSGSGALGDLLAGYVEKHSRHQGMRVRTDTLGYAQRSFPGIRSEVDAKVARMVGKEAVRYALKGDIDGSITISRISADKKPVFETDLVRLKKVAKDTQDMPAKFIAKNGHDVTSAFLKYLEPLVGELPAKGILAQKKVKKLS